MEIIKSLIPVAQAATYENIDDLMGLISRITGVIAGILFAVAAIYIIMAGWGYLSAKGDPAKTTSAKNQVIYAAVAIAIGILATSVEPIVRSFLGA